MKFRKLEIVLVVFVLLLTFSCVNVFAADVKLTWSSISVPGDAHTEAMKVFKEEVESLSAGHITVDLYIAGAIYTQEGELAAVREGTLDMAYYGTNWLAEFIPYLSMFSAVYTFSSYRHMTRVMNGEIGQRIFEEIAQKIGVRPLAAFYLGTRELNVVEKVGPVRTPEDLKGVKLRTPASPAWIALGKALGGNPTPMSFGEVYMGLKTGAVEGQDNPLPTDKNAKFYEVTKYIILTDHVVNAVLPTINEKKWQSLSDIDKLIIHKALEKAKKFCDETNLKAEAELLDFFREKGLIIIEDPDKAAFAAYAKNSYATESKDISKDWDMELYEEIQALK
ncbi:MAG: DctP family TRAP transporter solute-binding subunit [Candidatus Caldatribacteriota bacterium]|nr:DctP family TRAP transporter solute-binding subunit [Candidatus Caldatribacteriota bacterium]